MSSTEKVLRARIQLVDNFTNISNKVAKSATNLGKTFNEANKKLDKLIETSKSPIVIKYTAQSKKCILPKKTTTQTRFYIILKSLLVI